MLLRFIQYLAIKETYKTPQVNSPPYDLQLSILKFKKKPTNALDNNKNNDVENTPAIRRFDNKPVPIDKRTKN